MFKIIDIMKEIQEERNLQRIEMLYDKMIWLSKYDKEISVLDMSDDYFDNVLRLMRSRYGDKFNLFEREHNLRTMRQKYLALSKKE